MMDIKDLIAPATAVQQHAHAPYSKFRVGAALRAGGVRTTTFLDPPD